MQVIEHIRDEVTAQGGFYIQTKQNALAYYPNGTDHLVVAFDDLSRVGDKSPTREPWGRAFIAKNGWSHLAILAGEKDWYGEDSFTAMMQRLADTGFFKQFKKVTFYGLSMGGFAALVFSRLVPGAIVVAFSPQSTMDPEVLPGEHRWKPARVFGNWKEGRFRDATKGLETAGKIYIIHDPFDPDDRRQISRLPDLPNMVHLHLWWAGHWVINDLQGWGILKEIMPDLIEGRLDPLTYYRLLRQRRKQFLWVLHLFDANVIRDKQSHALKVLHWAVDNFEGDENAKARAHRRNLEAAIKAGEIYVRAVKPRHRPAEKLSAAQVQAEEMWKRRALEAKARRLAAEKEAREKEAQENAGVSSEKPSDNA